MPDDCEARQQSDQMYCKRCNLLWDMNDDDPPACDLTHNERVYTHPTKAPEYDEAKARIWPPDDTTYQQKYTDALAFITGRGLYSDFMKATGKIDDDTAD